METMTLERNLIEKRLKKYNLDQLLKKFENNNFSSDLEKEVCRDILIKRNKLPQADKSTQNSVNQAEDQLTLFSKAMNCLDQLYEKNDVKINRRVLAIFGNEDVEDYKELKDDQLLDIIKIHNEIFSQDEIKASESKKEEPKQPAKQVEAKTTQKIEKKADEKKSEPKKKVEEVVERKKGSIMPREKQQKSALAEDGFIILCEKDNRIKKESDIVLPVQGVTVKDYIQVKTKKGDVLEGLLTGIFDGKYEKDIVFIVNLENGKSKWLMQKTIEKIKIIKK